MNQTHLTVRNHIKRCAGCGALCERHVCQSELWGRSVRRRYGWQGDRPHDYYVIIDLEATCDTNFSKGFGPQEIIEFAAVILNTKTGQIEAKFQVFIKPEVHPTLTPFCVKLTGITQDQVDNGATLEQTLACFHRWLTENGLLPADDWGGVDSPPIEFKKPKSFAFVTWTDWDLQTMLEGQCARSNLRKGAYFDSWINLKAIFLENYPIQHCSLLQATKILGMEWEGRAHSGLADCVNTAALLMRVLADGAVVNITSRFIQPIEWPAMVYVLPSGSPTYHRSSHHLTAF